MLSSASVYFASDVTRMFFSIRQKLSMIICAAGDSDSVEKVNGVMYASGNMSYSSDLHSKRKFFTSLRSRMISSARVIASLTMSRCSSCEAFMKVSPSILTRISASRHFKLMCFRSFSSGAVKRIILMLSSTLQYLARRITSIRDSKY